MNDPPHYSRRGLLRSGAAAAAAAIAGSSEGSIRSRRTGDPWHGLTVGVASYTLRLLPLADAIRAIQRVDLHSVSIKDAHLPLNSTPEQRRGVVQRFRDAGITPLSCGNITLGRDEPAIRRAFDYARDAGIPTIVCSPDPDSIPVLDRLVREYDLRIAIHNHGPGDRRYPSPYDAWDAVQGHDPRLGLCIDVGHAGRAGIDPAKAIRRCASRVYEVHFKDITAATGRGAPIEVGRGVLDIPSILRALIRIRYRHQISFEYEKDASDPLPGLAESVGYTRGLLAEMG